MNFTTRRPGPGVSNRARSFRLLAMLMGMILIPMAVSASTVEFDCDGDKPFDPCQFCGFTDTLCVFVDIDASTTDLRGASFVFGFDPTFVLPISVEAWGLSTGSCAPFVAWINQATFANTIEVDIAGLGCSYTGPGTILRICFTGPVPNMEGVSPFTCLASDLRDSTNQMLSHTCGSAVLTNVCPVPVQQTTWGQLKNGFRTLTVTYP